MESRQLANLAEYADAITVRIRNTDYRLVSATSIRRFCGPIIFIILDFDMRFKRSEGFTFEDYLYKTWYNAHETDMAEMYPKLEQMKLLAGPPAGMMPMFFVLDYTTRNYVVSTESLKQLLGYDARELLESGWDFTFHAAQKDYFKVFNEKVFPATVASLKRTPQREHKDQVFSYNFQYRHNDGRYVNTLQKCSFITQRDTGLPVYCIGMIIDIHEYSRHMGVVQTVEKIDPLSHALCTVEKNYYYPYEEDALLTLQEKNVLKYLADGLSSKMIAYRLGIAENTIANHRKNMLRKTNTKNVAQLIAFSVRKGII